MPTKDAIGSTMARVLAEAGVLSCRSNGLLEPSNRAPIPAVLCHEVCLPIVAGCAEDARAMADKRAQLSAKQRQQHNEREFDPLGGWDTHMVACIGAQKMDAHQGRHLQHNGACVG